MKILIIQQKMIGDVLTSSILCELLKKAYPNAEIHYVINSHTYPVIEGNPFVDQLIFFKKEYREHKLSFYRFLKDIRNEKYDITIDAYAKLESKLITLFSGSKKKISFNKKYASIFYNTLVDGSTKNQNLSVAIQRRLSLVTPLVKLPKPISPKIYLSDKEIDEASRFLEKKNVSQSSRMVMISILGSELGKTYPFSYMALLLNEFTKVSQATLLFNYIPSQLAHVNAIYNLCNAKTKKQIRRDVYAPSLRSFLGVLSHCDALIGNEGGAVNMAKALQIPTFAIFSPWIKKENWNMSDNEKEYTSVHLKDYYPEKYSNQNRKFLKKQTQELYHIFEPDLFLDKLKEFIKHNLS